MKLIGRPIIQAGVVVLLQLLIDLRHSRVIKWSVSPQHIHELFFEKNLLFEDHKSAPVLPFSPPHGGCKPDLAHIAIAKKSAAQINVFEDNLAWLGELCQCKHGAGLSFNLRLKLCIPKFSSIKKPTALPSRSMKF